MTPALEAINITKQFPGVLANDHINFDLKKGEIHALLGENGAGKTTLMNILFGLYQPDEGEIKINGVLKRITSPHDAIANGIGMVHQHFMLVQHLTVAENIMLGQETTIHISKILGPLALLDRRKVTGQIKDLSREYSLMVEPDALISDLTVGAQQRVEIIKALYRHADILILDEPTSVLTPQEADELFAIMRSLAKQGKSIIFITHKLREVLAVADRISVMREGKMIGTVTPAGTTQEMLAEMMVGRKVILSISKNEAHPGQSVLEVDNLRVLDERKHMVVNGVSFQVREGEILGIAGVQGNGQTELTEVLTGLRRPVEGRTLILGHETTFYNPRKVFETGTSHIPEDRQKHGLVLSFPVRDNFVLNTYYQKPFSHGVELDFGAIQQKAENLVNTFDVRTPSIETLASSLSG